VQKKLHMRIEAQGKYLHDVLEKAQRTLSMKGSGSDLEPSFYSIDRIQLCLVQFHGKHEQQR
ncbi:hypothetical protein HN51_066159, partial [Arachis hypogaea]